MSERNEVAILGEFTRLHYQKSRTAPGNFTIGLARALVRGELTVTTDMPMTWPLSTLLPLLKQAYENVAADIVLDA
jgi:hypothetical protein